MIDVVFQLIIFFICTASFQQVEHVLPSSLSTAAGAAPSDRQDPPPPEADFDDLVVRIEWVDGGPKWRLNETPVGTLEELRDRLTRIAKVKSDAPVVLHPDQQTPIGNAIDVYDISRLAGFEKVQFAASEDVRPPLQSGSPASGN
jgi:biopolymer transport protein ExbD